MDMPSFYRIRQDFDTTCLAVEAALDRTSDPHTVRMARIVSTGELESFWETAAVLPKRRKRDSIKVDDTAVELKFSRFSSERTGLPPATGFYASNNGKL